MAKPRHRKQRKPKEGKLYRPSLASYVRITGDIVSPLGLRWDAIDEPDGGWGADDDDSRDGRNASKR
jgi:hypothetical protein